MTNEIAEPTGVATEPDDEFDRFAAMVRRVLDVPVALVALVEPLSPELRSASSRHLCQDVVATGRPLVVADARADDRLRDNPAVQDLRVVAYAGMPLTDASGRVVGALCAIAHEPREFTTSALRNLRDLAAACSSSLARHEIERRSREAQVVATRAIRQARLLLSFSESMIRTSTEDEVVAAVRTLSHGALDAEYSGVAVSDRRGVRYVGDDDLPPGASPGGLAPDPGAELPGPRVMRTGRALMYPDESAFFADFPLLRDDRTYAAVGARAYLPLVAGGRLLGWLALGWRAPREMDGDLAELMASLAESTSQAMHRAALIRQRQETARTLQEALLSTLPAVPGLELAARYRAASEGEKVGGDWYDAVASPRRTTLVIGDVAGHDVAAAAEMGQLRGILRGFAVDHAEAPSALLGRLDRANLALGSSTVATALVAHLEMLGRRHDDAARLTWSSAGHYAPVLVHSDGSTDELRGRSDLLLGVDGQAPRTDHVDRVPVGSTLLLFTDGLVELRGQRVADRLEALRDAASHVAAEPLDVLLDAVLAAMAHTHAEDDIAVLAARPVRPPGGAG